MYQALYRKYRPRSFDDVVGQEHITETLKTQVETGRLSHAYLFVGTRGTGKTTCAKILARAVNCERPVNGNPCNECAACRGILDGSILDVVELDAASNNGVDNVRALRDEAVFSPASVKKRVYIIDEVHMLSTAAFNALLKILEEPPEHLMFILCTTELRKVLPTIVSRCQRHSFKRLSPADIAGRLLWVAGQEGIDLTEDAARLLARLADGGMRDGLSLLDQCSAAAHIDEEAVLSSVGLAGGQKTAELLDAVFARDSEKALAIFNALWQAGKDPAGILDELAGLMRDVLLTQVAPEGCAALISGAWPMSTLLRFSKSISGAELLADLTAIENAPTGGSSPRRSAELCLVSLCAPDCGEGLAALRARVARLERAVESGVPVSAPASAPVAAPASPVRRESAVDPGKAGFPQGEFTLHEDVQIKKAPMKSEDFMEDDYERPPLPDDDYFAPPEDIAPAPARPKPAPPVPAAPAVSGASAAADGEFWERLLPRLEGKLETYIYALLLPASQTTGELSGSTLTVHVTNPFALATVERAEVKSVLQRQASELCGRDVTVAVTDRAAPGRTPNEEKLAGLNRFSNFKME